VLLTKRVVGIFGLGLMLVSAQAADAGTSLDINAALGIASGTANAGISSISPGFGAEFGFGLTGNIEAGALFTYNLLMDGSSNGITGSGSSSGGQVLFYGAKLRYYFEGTMGVFGDVLLGLTQGSQQSIDSTAGFGFGLRIGSKIPFGGNSLVPYAGFRSLPFKTSIGDFGRTMFDIGIMYSFSLYGG